MTYALASNNPGKILEIQDILSGMGIRIVTGDDLGITMEIEETGTTFLENAMLKARAVCEASGLPAIADDSGLCVDALGGAPGVYTSSFGGEGLADGERNKYLLQKLENTEQRGANFVCTIVCAFPDGSVISAAGECKGRIARTPGGAGGFGYDPVFIAEGYDVTMAQLPPGKKNAISHRGKALREFAGLLMQKTGEGEW